MSRKRGRGRRRKTGQIIASIFIVMIMSLCIYQIAGVLGEYTEAKDTYEEIKEEAKPEPDKGPDFSKLPDNVTAWVTYEGLNIDYPVVQSKNEQEDKFWLHHLTDGTYNFAGTLFFPSWAKESDQNRVIYGHAMNNGSMFGSLKKLKEQAFYDEHQKFTVYFRSGKKEVYQTFAVYETQDLSPAYEGNFEDFWKWKQSCWAASCVTTPKATNGNVITLSTCTNRTFYGRIVAHGSVLSRVPYDAEGGR